MGRRVGTRGTSSTDWELTGNTPVRAAAGEGMLSWLQVTCHHPHGREGAAQGAGWGHMMSAGPGHFLRVELDTEKVWRFLVVFFFNLILFKFYIFPLKYFI